jgi:hypothetical protein
MEIKNLINNCTFILGETPHKNKLIIPVKLVLKAKQTTTGKLEKLKACVVARGKLEKHCTKKQKLHTNNILFNNAKTLLKLCLLIKPMFNQLTYLNLLKTPGLPMHFQEEGVKLLLSTTCATRRTLKNANFIGTYL